MPEVAKPQENAQLFQHDTIFKLLSDFWVEGSGYAGMLDALSRTHMQLGIQNSIATEEVRTSALSDGTPVYHLYDMLPVRIWEADRDRAEINRIRVRRDEPLQAGYKQRDYYEPGVVPAVGGFIKLSGKIAYPLEIPVVDADNAFLSPSKTGQIPCTLKSSSIMFSSEQDPFMSRSPHMEDTERGRSMIIWLHNARTDRQFPRRLKAWLLGMRTGVNTSQDNTLDALLEVVRLGVTRDTITGLVHSQSSGNIRKVAATPEEFREMWPEALYIPASITGCVPVSLGWEAVQRAASDPPELPISYPVGQERLEIQSRMSDHIRLYADSFLELYDGAEGASIRGGSVRLEPALFFSSEVLSGHVIYIECSPEYTDRVSPGFTWRLFKQLYNAENYYFVFSRTTYETSLPVEVLAGKTKTYSYNSTNSVVTVRPTATDHSVVSKSLCIERYPVYDAQIHGIISCRACG